MTGDYLNSPYDIFGSSHFSTAFKHVENVGNAKTVGSSCAVICYDEVPAETSRYTRLYLQRKPTRQDTVLAGTTAELEFRQ